MARDLERQRREDLALAADAHDLARQIELSIGRMSDAAPEPIAVYNAVVELRERIFELSNRIEGSDAYR